MTRSLFLSLVVVSLPFVTAKCFDPSPAFPLPSWSTGAEELEGPFETIERKLAALISDEKYDTSSFSVQLTSSTDNLWSHFHTARKHDAARPGDTHVDGDSIYRIASITKTFTVLGILQQHTAGNLSLDDPVSAYIPELAGPDSGDVPWKDITLRILASQLSGIPRESGQADLMNALPDPTEIGLPPASRKDLPTCYEYSDYGRQCNRTDLFDELKKRQPVFAPNQQSTYSNVAFELLGVVIENVSGMNYSEYIQHAMFDPFGMNMSSLEKPSDEHAVLPDGPNFWDAIEGIHAPAGAIYSTATDMSMYLRYILTHYNSLATGVNWMMPASWATGIHSFYGMPFEIFRTDTILEDSRRPVTFVTKGGGVPGYFTDIVLMPEYDLGLTILTAGDLTLVGKIREIVTLELVRAAEKVVWKRIDQSYSGDYIATNSSLNSSVELTASSSTGLVMSRFLSNGTDVLEALAVFLGPYAGVMLDGPWRAQLVPTLLFKNETAQKGEIWRVIFQASRDEEKEMGVWDDFCNTDVETLMYAGLPINEVVFWHEEDLMELPAWNLTAKKSADKSKQHLVVQLQEAYSSLVLLLRSGGI